MDQFIYSTLENLPVIILLISIGLSLYVLGKGADLLVDQAVSISIKWGIPKMIVGATIVSLGTTIPEVTVSVMSAIKGNPDMAMGNAVGSIIANTALILGLSSMLGHVPVDKKSIDRQGKILVGASLLLAVFSLPFFGDGVNGHISQLLGFLFVLLLVAYIISTIRWARKRGIKDDSGDVEVSDDPLVLQLVKLFIGIALVIVSSKVLIPSVEIVATRLGIPQSIIASTLVAFGTSLPELVTAVTSVRRGHGELAVGNVVGANILNILFVIGLSAAVTKEGLIVPAQFIKLHIPVMLITLAIFMLCAKSKNGEISKREGFLLMSIYVVYLILSYFLV